MNNRISKIQYNVKFLNSLSVCGKRKLIIKSHSTAYSFNIHFIDTLLLVSYV